MKKEIAMKALTSIAELAKSQSIISNVKPVKATKKGKGDEVFVIRAYYALNLDTVGADLSNIQESVKLMSTFANKLLTNLRLANAEYEEPEVTKQGSPGRYTLVSVGLWPKSTGGVDPSIDITIIRKKLNEPTLFYIELDKNN